MQVLLSMQSLVMTKDIIQSEPGMGHLHTQSVENQAYSAIVKYGNLAYAMIETLKNPPTEFKEIVFKHFALKKEKILQTVQKWISELPNLTEGLYNRIVNSHNSSVSYLFKQTPPRTLLLNLFEELETQPNTLPP